MNIKKLHMMGVFLILVLVMLKGNVTCCKLQTLLNYSYQVGSFKG